MPQKETASLRTSIQPISPPSSETPQADTSLKTPEATTEIHIYTLPNRAGDYYQNSDLFRDILENPTLYIDRADF